MGLLSVANFADPRLQQCAYLTDGKRLAEVDSVRKEAAVLIDCRTDERIHVKPADVTTGWELVRPAPAGVPDSPSLIERTET